MFALFKKINFFLRAKRFALLIEQYDQLNKINVGDHFKVNGQDFVIRKKFVDQDSGRIDFELDGYMFGFDHMDAFFAKTIENEGRRHFSVEQINSLDF